MVLVLLYYILYYYYRKKKARETEKSVKINTMLNFGTVRMHESNTREQTQYMSTIF
jgi:heme/copper-type cytochrome/quinol oxidase subunit 2